MCEDQHHDRLIVQLTTAQRILQFFFPPIVYKLNGIPSGDHLIGTSPKTIRMQIVCALAVLVATLAMLGVPKDHGGPKTKSHSCKRPAKNFGAHFWARHSHSHNKPHKCEAVFHGKQGGAGGRQERYASKATKRKGREKKSNESSRL